MTTEPAATVADLARRHGLELVRFAYLLTGDRHRAEDLVQDVLLAMHRRFPTGFDLDNPLGYARRALANTHINLTRRAASGEMIIPTVPDSRTESFDDPADRDAMWQALRTLPLRQRTVLLLRYYADFSDSDIATVIGARRATVRSLAARGLAALRNDPDLDFSDGAR